MAKTSLINLSTGRVEITDTDPALLQRFLGGRGLGARLLFDLVGPQVEPFDPRNCLIFTSGVFSGTPWPTASRYHVTFKSPATGGYGYANSGGGVGPELASAGFDALIVTGQASSPVYLKVTQEAVSIEPADHLWGKTTSFVQDTLLADNKGRVVCIGEAGEKLVRIAALINDYGRAAARGGPGAVMGSKRLKAVHILATGKKSSLPEFIQAVKTASQHLINDPKMQGLISDGTVFLMRPKNLSGDLPAKNHQLAQVPFIDALDARALKEYRVKRMGCKYCPVRCSCLSAVEDGPYATEVEGPEYETTAAFGPLCWNPNPEVIMRANHLCNEYGLDTISTGVVIAFAMECHEKGLLSDAQLTLEWGDAASILNLIERIGRREGLGDILAEGTQRAAQRIGGGAEHYAMHVKGLEIPRQEPRIAKGFGLGHATSNRGADHLYGMPAIDLGGNFETARKIFPPEIIDKLMDPADETYKADMLVYGEHFCAVTDSLGICKFSTVEEYSLLPQDLLPGLHALGLKMSAEELLQTGERIVNLERLYNIRAGFGRQDDHLPLRFTTEAVPILANEVDPESGETRLGRQLGVGQIFDFDAMLDRYYHLRGWDADGRPTPEAVERLGLAEEGKDIVHA